MRRFARMWHPKVARRLACALAAGVFSIGSPSVYATPSAQPPVSHTETLVNKGVVPPLSVPLAVVRQDPGALAVIRAYQIAVGRRLWENLVATGTVVPETHQPTRIIAGQPATLWISGTQAYRLDIETPRGSISIRIEGASGGIQQPNGHMIRMDSRDAAVGLFAFPLISNGDFPNKQTSLMDQGTVQVDGVTLHRVTAEIPWSELTKGGKKISGVGITDLYFDPSTHLLVKSVNVLQGTDPRLARDVRVISYQDYRPAFSGLLPYRLMESVEGHHVWTLQITQIASQAAPQAVDYRFAQ